jgi:hypothetical protein
MGDPKIGDYKSSTILRALCWYMIGLQSSKVNFSSLTALIPMAIFGFGIYASKAKNPTQMKIFTALVFLVTIGPTLFNLGISAYKTNNANANGNGGSDLLGLNININGIPGIIQLAVSAGMLYSSYNMW